LKIFRSGKIVNCIQEKRESFVAGRPDQFKFFRGFDTLRATFLLICKLILIPDRYLVASIQILLCQQPISVHCTAKTNMVPALIIAALAALLLFTTTSHSHSAEGRFAAGNHDTSKTFVSTLASKPIGGSGKTPRVSRRASLTDHTTKTVLTSINSCKFAPARRATFRWPPPLIRPARDFIRPTG